MPADTNGRSGDSANDLSGESRDVVQAGNVSGDIHFHQAPAASDRPRTVPRQLPADVHAFVNRTAELGQLDAILTGRDGGQLVVSVHVVAGTAGAGKTSLVLHWAHRVRDRFPDGQLFVNLRGHDPREPVTAEQALRGFLRALGVAPGDVPQDVDDAAALYRSLLADRRMLIVLDNAATVGQVRPLLPGSGDSLTVVTSRNRLAALAVRDGARRITLGTLPEPEAVALLRTVTRDHRPGDDPDKLTELARRCAHLPLALRIAAERAAGHPHLSLDDLLADLHDESALWDALSTGTDEEAEAVRTVFAWSYRALPPHSGRLFRLLGLHPGPEFGLQAAAALAGLPLSRARQLLDDLVGAHLLEQSGPDRFQFHDLLRAYASEQAHDEEPAEQREAALRRVLDRYLHTADAAQTWLQPGEDHLPLPETTTPLPPPAFADYDAAADWAERERATFPHLVRAAAAAGLHQHAWQLTATLWNALSASVSFADWLGFGHIGLASAEHVNDTNGQLLLLNQLGMSHRSANRLDLAADHLSRALDLARTTGNRGEEAHALNLVGLVHLRARRLDAAAAHFAEAIGTFREVGGERWAAAALSNVAGAHLEAGRLEEADTAIQAALSAHRALDNRQSIGNARWLAAQLHRERDETEAAREAIDEALGIALGLRNRGLEGFWLLALGDIQRTTGQHGDALASYQRSAMLHRRLGDRSREALAWRGTGQAYAAMDRHGEAAAFHRQAAAVHRDLGDAWELAVELGHLAAAVHPQDPEAARAHRTEALTHLTPYTDPRATAVRARLERQLTEADC
ncbi:MULTISPECIES: ATP-binding protein [Streptomyces]|uniref:ATP-binding protein n=1 Tax=Streptomyces TaxID=1883 RepID=UPI001FD1819D|nr:tetratricopeptide repeat protein [Streptomyces kasugaensis]